ncbi:hypothetical protein GPECTOR_17g925 [Gonium pectorale]|uniref:Uncharacterized protein n=1 Tax=Gonium pectorale TaxID=33097 RepID=A0A150GKB6_GONPE|nr:hypothetical protein GPECTOR_17g925 [Gonium pectorale]|eukprot:KXZ50286.1 hypothetical protein GPECTOR_17g925 [Gonium pectorale]
MSGTSTDAPVAMRVWPQLLPELAAKIVSHLEQNEVPNFRLVNKAAAAQFSAPNHTTYRLSQPVPPHAFAAKWLAPGSTGGLTLKRRRQLLYLTAASGLVPNLEAAVQAAGCLLTYEVFEAAAAAGKLESCQWLWDQGCPTTSHPQAPSGLLAAAAGGGHGHLCEWLLGLGLAWASGGASEAARGGHAHLMEWLLQQRPQLDVQGAEPAEEQRLLFAAVAHGCDLPTLQRFWHARGTPDAGAKEETLAAAAGSPAPDWAAKVEWLVAQGCPRATVRPANMAARRPDAAARLAWLRSRDYPMDSWTVWVAAGEGNVATLQYLLAEAGVSVGDPDPEDAALRASNRALVTQAAAREGHLAVLQALHAAGWPLGGLCALEAVRGGHMHVLAWLVETLGAAGVGFAPGLFNAAAQSGGVVLMAWLRERGCAWGRDAFASAAMSGCEEAVEWLVAQGCPMETMALTEV